MTAAPCSADPTPSPTPGPILGLGFDPLSGPGPVRLGLTQDLADLDLNAPIWTVQHIAVALHLDLGAACAVVARPDFPLPRDGFAADLWLREHVLAWFADLPPRGLGPDSMADAGHEAAAAAPASAIARGRAASRPGQGNSYRRRRTS